MKRISATFLVNRITVTFVLMLTLCASAWGQDTVVWKDPTGVTPGEVDRRRRRDLLLCRQKC